MKKVLFLILISIIGIINVRAADLTEKFYYHTKVPNMYITKVKGSNVKNGAPFLIQKSNGSLVYCIEPFNYVADNTYNGYYGYNSIFGLTKNQINRMNLVAYYGYGYNNHTDLKWYGVTQYLIWDTLNLDDLYFTDSYYGNRITAYTSEINEIKNLVDNYQILPSFRGKVYNFSIKNTYTIEDTNKVLNNYDITTNSNNLKVTVNNNKLNITAIKEGQYTVTFTKKDNRHNYELYYHNDGQNLIFPGKIDDISTTITVNVYKGKVKVIKKDIEIGDSQINNTFKNAVYGLYKTNIDELVDTVTLNDEGVGIFDELPLNDYYVREITPPEGYLLDDTKYSVSLSYNNREQNIEVYDQVIKKDISIHKYYGNQVTNRYFEESGVIFNLYDLNDNLIDTFTTDDSGYITFNVKYGDYILRQMTTKEGYSLNEDIKLSIRDNIGKRYELYDYELINCGVLNLTKKGSDNKLLDKVKFKIYASEDIKSLDGTVYYHKGDLVDSLITLKGQAKSKCLYYGNYYIEEEGQVKGYKNNHEQHQFQVNKDNIYLTLINNKIIDVTDLKQGKIETEYVKVPNTGKDDIDYLETIGILFVLFGYCLGLYLYNKLIGIY